MKRILIVASDFYPSQGGYANAMTSFVENLNKYSNIDIDVITFTPLEKENEMKIKGINVHRMNWLTIGRGFNFILNEYRLARKIIALERKNNYNAIMFESATYPISGLILLMKKNISRKLFVRVHASAETEWVMFINTFSNKIRRYFTKRFFRKIPTITSTNRYHIDFVRKYFLFNNPLLYGEKLFFIIPNTSITIKYNKIEEKEMRKTFQYIRNKHTFLTLGRMEYPGYIEKNFSRILDAIFQLKGKKYYNKLLFLFIGRGKGKQKLQELSERLGISDKVVFIDRFLDDKEIKFLQKNVSCVILASLYEGMSSFALECLKSEACLLFSDTGGLIDLVEEGYNGYLFDPINSTDIAKNIDMIINRMFPKLPEVRKNSGKLYNDKFEPEDIIHSFLGFLEMLEAYGKIKS